MNMKDLKSIKEVMVSHFWGNINDLKDNQNKDKEFLLNSIRNKELSIIYSDGGEYFITSSLNWIFLISNNDSDILLSQLSCMIKDRIQIIKSWFEMIENEKYNHDVFSELLNDISVCVYESENDSRFLLPKLLYPVLEKFGKNNQKELIQLIQSVWSSIDHTYHLTDILDKVFSKDTLSSLDISKGTNDEDIEFYNSLPEQFKVYRGCYYQNKDGYSWSTSKDVSRKFPFLSGNTLNNYPILIQGIVSKKDVLFCVVGRNEYEIVVNPKDVKRKVISNIKKKKIMITS